MHDISIIIVAWNVIHLVDECLGKIRASKDGLKKQILFVDNGSSDGTGDLVRNEYPEVEYIWSETNLGFIRANNLAYPHATGRYVLMLNSDAFVGPETLARTVAFMDTRPEYGALGCRLIGRDGALQPSGRNFPTPWRIFVTHMALDRWVGFLRGIDDRRQDSNAVRDCDWVTGCYLLARKSALDQLDFFLRPDYFMYNDDNDLCLRLARRGWKTVYFPEDVVHLGGENAKQLGQLSKTGNVVNELSVESTYLYFRKNYGVAKVLSLYLWGLLFRVLQLSKRVFLRNKRIVVAEEWDSISVETRLLFQTRFGAHSIH
jgi:GT2 family glycosyltransferase